MDNYNKSLNFDRTDKDCKTTVKYKIKGNKIIIKKTTTLETNNKINLRNTLDFFKQFNETGAPDHYLQNIIGKFRGLNFSFTWLKILNEYHLAIWTRDDNKMILSQNEVRKLT